MRLFIGLAFAAVLALGTWLEPWFQQWAGSRTRSTDLLTVVLGDSRRLFAKHIYAKADAYFHRGYYPSIFDARPESDEMHMATGAAGTQDEPRDSEGVSKPRDWIEAFGRNFYPSKHTHLGEGSDGCCDHDQGDHEHGADCQHEHGPDCGHAAASKRGEEREMLPWLKLAATLDPEMPDTYVVAAHWLRNYLGKIDEAEEFLRAGLRSNPGHPGMLFELGRIFKENRKDIVRARNVWEIGVERWEQSGKSDRELLVYAQLLGNLARLEEEQKNFPRAINHVRQLIQVSPNKAALEKWIHDMEAAQQKPQ